jgi:hypothetical protein
MSPFDSKITYVVTQRFLQRIYERTQYEDVVGLLDGMCLSLDGERSMDPALVYDWGKATRGKATFTKKEGFEAAKAFLRYWYHIGPQEDIKSIIGAMENRNETWELWNECWNEVSANLNAGEPFKTAFCYGTNTEGKPGRLQRNASTGFHEFLED